MQEADKDIFDLNLLWLFKAREFARSNRTKAAVIFGFDEATTEKISRLSLKQLHRISRSGVMVFQPRFHPRFWHEMLEDGEDTSVGIQFQTLLMAINDVSNQ